MLIAQVTNAELVHKAATTDQLQFLSTTHTLLQRYHLALTNQNKTQREGEYFPSLPNLHIRDESLNSNVSNILTVLKCECWQ